MKRLFSLIISLAILSTLSGYLLSKASWVGRVGISLFYNQYNFLKTWWKGGLVIFGVLMILLTVQTIIQKKLSSRAASIVQVFMLIAAIAGLYFTYQDFRHHLSHRFLGERFHIGFYLFWISWMIISIFYILQRKQTNVSSTKDTAEKL